MIHQRLERLRELRGLSKAELARQIHMAATTYSGYSLGNREPDIETLKMFADFYGVTLDFLIKGDISKDTYMKNEVAGIAEEFLTLEIEDQKTIIDLIRRMKKNSR